METDNENRPIRIFTLGRFEILREGDSVRFVRKVQRKPLELLKAIISFGGKKVPEDQITDTLWPDAEGDMAHQSFETTLYRLRRLLGNDMVIVLQGGQITLDDKYCWLDTWAFDQICEKIEIFFKRMEESDKKKPWEILVPEIRNSKRETQDPAIQNTSSATIEYLQSAIEDAMQLSGKIFSVYKGSFLPSDARYLWTVSTRERLRNKFSRLIIMLGNFLELSGQWKSATEHYQKAIETNDLAEEFYQHLMICHYQRDQCYKAIEVYLRLEKTFSVYFGIKPSRTTEAMYKALISENT